MTLKISSIRHNEYYDFQFELDKIYNKSINNEGFRDLIKLITDDRNILLAFRNIKRNKGSKTPGVNGNNIKTLETMTNEEIINLVKSKIDNYKSGPVKRVLIPKPNGKKRPLGIPNIEDRLIQQCIKQILEPICEAKFHERSNGFRPDRSTENAIAQCYKMINQQKLYYVVNIDIKGFFDNVNHRKLRQQIWNLGIKDKKLISIINEMLKSPIYDNGEIIYSEKGTPQGGILSPLLSNIVLNELDWWVSSQWETFETKTNYKCENRGKKDNTIKYRALRKTNLKEIYIVRYADDFKIFCRNHKDAERAYYAVIDFLKTRLFLEVNTEKSGITNIKNKKFDFLGFSIGTIKKGNKLVVKSNVSRDNINRISKNVKNQFKKISKSKNSPKYEIDRYNHLIMGLHNYYNKATYVNMDFSKLKNDIYILMNNLYGNTIEKDLEIKNGYIKKTYGKSKMVRFLNGKPIIPVGYVQHKNPMYKNSLINRYTTLGRLAIHENLKFSINKVNSLIYNNNYKNRVEYHDNRISKYCSQYGRCFITDIYLEIDEIHCHHIIPYSISKDDSYENLVIIHKDIHILVHATESSTINTYLKKFNLDEKALNKLNKFRKILNLDIIQ